MKGCFIFLTLVTVTVAMETYSSKYDNVDVDRILANGRVLSNYIRCIMDEGSCTAEGRELKKILPDALATECQKCTENQKATAEKVIRHLRTKRPRDWERLVNKYDPYGQYKKRFETLQPRNRA
ncbi:ejaculatory bulb-specific protein 3 [Orussus abietinus]|uniref:ejaculatory bulb-specific protein 3 n=1 Tax=Orussus abietinus TaxID=222816 RepID=UPI000626DEA8|nr:ejaculatory bulb-specific protein 3 [Orussus abietinus]